MRRRMQKNGHIDYKLKTELLESQLSVESAIVNYADKQDVDLIVIGTKRRSGLKKLLFGSVASG
jgi:nucleotide-binding universal stress UspA family protein